VSEYNEIRLKYFQWGLVSPWTKASQKDEGKYFAPQSHCTQRQVQVRTAEDETFHLRANEDWEIVGTPVYGAYR
ncbi:MAG: hypothetical protein AAFW00_12050, partial [Bacteroidota bacterium]